MKTKCILLAVILSTCVLNSTAQSFKKGSFLLSISEGSTTANYSTGLTQQGQNRSMHCNSKMDGVRDPLFIEFGLSRHWGIGLSSGNDLFTVKSKDFYGFQSEKSENVNVKTSEFTFDLNYHLYSSKRLDWSIYSSLGSFGVAFNSKVGENTYNYNAKGGIVRMGTKLRYYFWGRLGAMLMLSSYSGSANPSSCNKDQSLPNYSTYIKGNAIEYGLCFRFF